MNFHLHKYKFDCEALNGHIHRIIGHTIRTFGFNMFHFHFFCGISSYNGHTHYYSGITGMPIKTENGHIHKMEGMLELNNQHEHKFEGHTFEETAYIGHRLLREALI